MEVDLRLPAKCEFHEDELWRLVRRQTQRDVDIVWALHDFGPLTARQIGRAFFPDVNPSDGSQISRRLSLLRQMGDIYTLKRSGDHRHFHMVGPAFIRELAEHERAKAGWLWRRTLKNAIRSISSNHSVFVADVLSYFKSAEIRGQGELLDWSSEYRWEFRYSGQRWTVIPDIMGLWFSGATGEEVQFLAEADLGTETLEVITGKVFKYVLLLKRLGFARDRSGNPGFPLVLFISQSNLRADSVSKCVLLAAQKSGIRFDDLSQYFPIATTSLPLCEEFGITATIWDKPLDVRSDRSSLDELLPQNHLGGDFRLRCGMLDPRWRKLDPTLARGSTA